MWRTLCGVGLGALAVLLLLGAGIAANSRSEGERGNFDVEILAPEKAHSARVIGLARDGKAPPPPTPTATPEPTATMEPTATATPEAPIRVTGRGLSRTGMIALLRSTGWPASEWETALRVTWCESNWRPAATGKLSEASIFQIHPVHFWRFDGRDPWDPVYNSQVALDLWRTFGWGIWSCY